MIHYIKALAIGAITQAASMSAMAQGWPATYGGVMLQGFYWDSYVDTQWSNLEAQADEIAKYFDLVWVPQSGNCNSSYNTMGYAPVYWYDQNSSFGTEAQLRSMIKTLDRKGTGVIADVVINHRGSLGAGGSWVDFPEETYRGVTYRMGLADICSDDDGGKTAARYAVTGAKDTGEDWDGMRDLDHTSPNVQNCVTAYLNFLKDDMGYAGFRYDMTKGYAAGYTALYNSTVKPEFSVGEYWDGNLSVLRQWVDGTKKDGVIQSAAFDFPTRYAIRDACKTGNWSKLATKGLATTDGYDRYAVTFVENHDTQYRSSSEQGDPVTNYIEAANAYILATPGTPCVFLPHWKSYKSTIKQLITARKLAGVNNQSTTTTLTSSTGLYAAEVKGTAGRLIVALGTSVYTPTAGFTQIISGNRYKVYMSADVEAPWVSVASGTFDTPFSVKLTALSADAGARVVYTTDGTAPTAQSASVASGQSINIASSCTLKAGLLTGGTVKNVVTRTYEIKPFEPHTATVYVKNPGWSAIYFYAWANDAAGTQLNGVWPGNAVTTTKTIGGETWYYKTFDISTKDYTFNIIFDKGSNSDQTVDIGPIDEDKYYEISATKTNGKYTVTDITPVMTGIGTPVCGNAGGTSPLKIYSIGGNLLHTMPASTTAGEALQGLRPGVYIINGKKYVK